jgi:A/G-specific adenine glycosylase
MLCPTRAQGLQDQIPLAKKKTNYEDVTEIAVVITRGKKVLLRRCAANERWAGLWDFPRFAAQPVARPKRNQKQNEEIEKQAATIAQVGLRLGQRFTTIKHGVTRFRITLHCYEATWLNGTIDANTMQWIAPSDLEHVPLSVTGRKIAQKLLE